MVIITVRGGLGNQMFQYALSLKLHSLGVKVLLDLHVFDRVSMHNGYELEDIFRISADYSSSNPMKRLFYKLKYPKKREYSFAFDSEIEKSRDVILDGYWQSERYFESIDEQLRKKLTFPPLVSEENINTLRKIEESNSVSIHIRRGDYLSAPEYQGICTLDYYQRAIAYIEETVSNPHFFIFSNDISWCRENLPLENCTYVNGNEGSSSFRDMQLMSACKHNIIANSSFSWWGAWLNKHRDKIVIAPTLWLNDVDDSTIIPKEWIRI